MAEGKFTLGGALRGFGMVAVLSAAFGGSVLLGKRTKPMRNLCSLLEKDNVVERAEPSGELPVHVSFNQSGWRGPAQEPARQEAQELFTAPYNSDDLYEATSIIFSEAANQSELNRKVITRGILNRVKSGDYKDTIMGVLYDPNAFSCIKDKKNPNYSLTRKLKEMNGYEKMVFRECGENVKSVLDGERLGVPREDEIVAYHDVSVKIGDLRKKEKYWRELEEVYRNDRLIFYVPKTSGGSEK